MLKLVLDVKWETLSNFTFELSFQSKDLRSYAFRVMCTPKIESFDEGEVLIGRRSPFKKKKD